MNAGQPALTLPADLVRLVHEQHDSCCSCGRAYIAGEMVLLGYSPSQMPLYVGECCAAQLAQVFSRQVFQPRPYQVPPPDTLLWRYMDFTKFVALISKQALFFSRSDRFEDPFEGAKGVVERKREWEAYYLGLLIDTLKRPGAGQPGLAEDELQQRAGRLLAELELAGQSERATTFISCWHENEYESDAMWALYAIDRNQAVAVTSTYRKLYAALGRRLDIEIGRVRYIDFTRTFAVPEEAFWRKRKSFEHEREVRAVIHAPHSREVEGVFLPCDLDMLIGEVFVAPTAPRWFMELVIDLMAHYRIQKPVGQSSIRALPFY